MRPLGSLFRIVVLVLDNDCAPSYERDVETKSWSNHRGTARRKRWERISPTYDHRATSRLHKRPKNKIDVKAIRVGLDMTQEEFAGRFGFSVNILCHWEQGSRQPERLARAYLLAIERAPKAVQKALQAV